MVWHGWNEQEVQGQRSVDPAIMGFTAINATAPGPATEAATSHEAVVRGTSTDPRSVVSNYLGRGEDHSGTLLKAIRKKVNGKGKKRVANADESMKLKSKRRRSRTATVDRKTARHSRSDVLDLTTNMRQSKTENARKIVTNKQSSQATDAVGMESKNGTASNAMKSVSVFATSTSMDTLDSTSTRTSFNSVKANSGQSFMLYQGPSPRIPPFTIANFSQPWMSSNAEGTQATLAEISNPRTDKSIDNPQSKRLTKSSLSQKSSQHEFFGCATSDAAGAIQTRSAEVTSPVNCPVEGSLGNARSQFQTSFIDSSASRYLALGNEDSKLNQDNFLADEYRSELEDEDLMKLAISAEQMMEAKPQTPPHRQRKQNMRDVDEDEDYGGALLTKSEIIFLDQQAQLRQTSNSSVQPIIRKQFQPSILDRSPIFGASSGLVLRTCFRVGEALNIGSQAVRTKNDVIIELYARVATSWRESKPGRKQYFVLKDLYHDRPPYLDGTFELWNQSQLWDLDSQPFLHTKSGGTLSRSIAKMKRDGQKWKLEILNIWEATWEDVDHVAGIYAVDFDCGEGDA